MSTTVLRTVANSGAAISEVHSMRQTMMDAFKDLTPSGFDLDMMVCCCRSRR